MAGFAVDRIPKGSLAPLMAQALVLRDRHGRLGAIVTADVIGFDRTSVASMRHELNQQHGIEPQAANFCASHSHWTPATLFSVTLCCGPINPWYVAEIERIIVRLVAQAKAQLAPAQVSYGAVQTNIGHCRRAPGGKTWAPNPQGSYDTHTPVIHVTPHRGGRQIVITSHACHPTSSGAVWKWTPDYPGAFRDRIAKLLGGDARGMFAMGCGGDAKVTQSDPRTGVLAFGNDPRHARAAGRKLADAVGAAISRQTLRAAAPMLRCGAANGHLTMRRTFSRRRIEQLAVGDRNSHETWWARQMIAMPRTNDRFPYGTVAWQFGDDLTMLFLEGEVCSGLAPLARNLAKTPDALAFAYTNAVDAYIPTRQIVREGGYEGERSHRAFFMYGPFTDKIEQEFQRVVRKAVGNIA